MYFTFLTAMNTLTYEEMKDNVFTSINILDGYNNDVTEVGLAFHDHRVFVVHSSGYFRANTMIYNNLSHLRHCLANDIKTHIPNVYQGEK